MLSLHFGKVGCAGSRWGVGSVGKGICCAEKKQSRAVRAPVVFLARASQGSHAWSGYSFLAIMLVAGVSDQKSLISLSL